MAEADIRCILSYHTHDLCFALRLAELLRAAGVSLWMDRLDIPPDDDRLASLQQAFGTDATPPGRVLLLALISREYLSAAYCVKELTYASRLKLSILPIPLLTLRLDEMLTNVDSALSQPPFTGFINLPADDAAIAHQAQRLAESLQEHFGASTTPLDVTRRYLDALNVHLESHYGPVETLELLGQGERSLNQEHLRPRPRYADFWLGPSRIVLHTEAAAAGVGFESLAAAMSQHPRAVLAGALGMGKSVLLRQAATAALHRFRADPDNSPLPLYVDLSGWDGDGSLLTRLQNADPPPPPDALTRLQRGQAVLYLDGLSALNPLAAHKAAAWLSTDAASGGPVNAIMAYDLADDPLPGSAALIPDLGLPLLLLRPLVRAQAESFAAAYFGAGRLFDAAQTFIDAECPDDATLGRMAAHPFWLSMALLVHARRADAESTAYAATRAVMLSRALEGLLKPYVDPGALTGPLSAVLAALERLAWAMQEAQVGAVVSRAFALQHIPAPVIQAALRAGLLQQGRADLRFAHPLIQDHFTARGLTPDRLAQWLNEARRRPDAASMMQLTPQDRVVLQYVGLTHHPDALLLRIAEDAPYLALRAVADGARPGDKAFGQVLARLLADPRAYDPALLTRVGQMLAPLSDYPARARLLLSLCRVGSWDARSAAAQVLQAMPTGDLPGLSAALDQLDSQVKGLVARAVRMLGEDAAAVLIYRLGAPHWKTRQSAAWLLGVLKDPAAAPALVRVVRTDSDPSVLKDALEALGEVKDAAAIPALAAALRHKDWRVAHAAARTLGRFGRLALNSVIPLLDDPQPGIRRLSVEALKDIPHAMAHQGLLKATQDADPGVRAAAIKALHRADDLATLKRLAELLSDGAPLPEKGDKRTVADLAALTLTAWGLVPAGFTAAQWQAENRAGRRRLFKAMAARLKQTDADSSGSAGTAKARLMQLTALRDSEEVPLDADADDSDSILALWVPDDTDDDAALLAQFKQALAHEDRGVRMSAVLHIAEQHSVAALRVMLNALVDEELLVTDVIVQALVKAGDRVAPLLLDFLHSPDRARQAVAVDMLRLVKDPRAVPGLADLLLDEAPVQAGTVTGRMCDLAERALLAISTPEALQAVQTWRKRVFQAHAAANHREPGRYAPQADAVATPDTDPSKPATLKRRFSRLVTTMRGEDWQARQAAARAIQEQARALKDQSVPSVVAYLMGLLDDPLHEIRWAMVEALAWIRDAAAVPALTERLNDPAWTVRVAAVRALMEIGDVSAAAALAPLLHDREVSVREAAVEALGSIGRRQDVDHLLDALADPEEFVRAAAVAALQRLGGSSAAAMLATTALNDRSVRVRWLAADALADMAGPNEVRAIAPALYDTSRPEWEDSRVCDRIEAALIRINSPTSQHFLTDWRARQQQRD